MASIYNQPAGTVISVPAYWNGVRVRHEGILTDRWYQGERTVISNSKAAGGVVKQKLSVFLATQRPAIVGYLGRLHPAEVVQRALSQLGKPWALTDNCQHFVRWAHGVGVTSPQLNGAVTVFGLLGGIFLASRLR